jgi:hypothetical protein
VAVLKRDHESFASDTRHRVPQLVHLLDEVSKWEPETGVVDENGWLAELLCTIFMHYALSIRYSKLNLTLKPIKALTLHVFFVSHV